MAKKPISYPPQSQPITITPAEWASWINELPTQPAEPAYAQTTGNDVQDDLTPFLPPIIEESHQPQNLITADTLKATEKQLPARTAAPQNQLPNDDSDDFDLPMVPEIEEHYDSLTKATSGPRHLERALYGQVNPLLVAEYVFGIADESTLAAAYGMTLAELRQTIQSKPFITSADSLRKAWETNPQLDTQYRAKQSFDYLLPIITSQAADPKAHPALKRGMMDLLAKVANVMPKEQLSAGGGGNSYAIQIILPGVERKQDEDDDFRIIDSEEV